MVNVVWYNMKNILFTTPVLGYPAIGGPELRILNSIKVLNKISKLYILSRSSKHCNRSDKVSDYFKKNSIYFDYIPSLKKNIFYYIKNIIIFRIKKIKNKICKTTNSNLLIVNILNKVLYLFFLVDTYYICYFVRKYKIDIIWFGYGNISYDLMKALKNKLPNIKMICDTDSVWSRYILRRLEYETEELKKEQILKNGKIKELEEKDWVNFMDITTAVSEEDANYYKGLAIDKKRIKIFSNVIDVEVYSKKTFMPVGFKKPSIYLAGSFFQYSPMENAARWVINEVFPIVKSKIENVKFYIIGNNSDKYLYDISDEDIIITGKVDSVLPYLCHSDVAIVPLKFESGTRFKILEAGICGVPIVSTSLGAEGLDVKNGENILIGDTPKEFAFSIIKLIENNKLASSISESCKRLIENKYCLKNLEEEASKIIMSN